MIRFRSILSEDSVLVQKEVGIHPVPLRDSKLSNTIGRAWTDSKQRQPLLHARPMPWDYEKWSNRTGSVRVRCHSSGAIKLFVTYDGHPGVHFTEFLHRNIFFTTHIGLERPQYNGARLIFSCRWASSPTVSLSVVTTANHTATSAVYSCSSVKYASLLGSRCIPPPRNLSRSNLVHENVESASLRWSGSAADAWFGGKESWKPLYKFMQKIAKIYVTSSSRIHRIRRNLSESL